MENKSKVCKRCILDQEHPDIQFDDNGICNYCLLHDALSRDYPNHAAGEGMLMEMVEKIKKEGQKKEYDCIIGVSGGTDSMFLTHWAKKAGMRPLAVNFDNGWHSEIAVSNIHKVLTKLNVDLETYVVDYEEMKDVLLSYMKAGLPWIDFPTDIALVSTLYRAATKYGIKYILVGNNFRTEGKQPTEWTYSDGKQLKHIQKKFGTKKLVTFPNETLFDSINWKLLKRIKMIKPLYMLPYKKDEAMRQLQSDYDWKYYGGHHHESMFTKFSIAYWQWKKFGIDKRKVTLSALVRSGEISREEALEKLKLPPYDPDKMEEDKNYVIQKLGITKQEFEQIWKAPNKSFNDYPSYYPLYLKLRSILGYVFVHISPFKPMMTYGVDTIIERNRKLADRK